jgi:hypothetical protein
MSDWYLSGLKVPPLVISKAKNAISPSPSKSRSGTAGQMAKNAASDPPGVNLQKSFFFVAKVPVK